MKNIDYIQIVDEMNDEAFEFCVSQLYPLFKYKIMKQDEVRRKDLKKILLTLEELIPKEKEMLRYYFDILYWYLKKILCKQGSRAEKYISRAREAMNKALNNDGTLKDIDDVVVIFISLFRSIERNNMWDKLKLNNAMMQDTNFGVEIDDVAILKKLWKSEKYVPTGIKKDEISIIRKVIYINNIIFLCRNLQNCGGFIEEDEQWETIWKY